MNKRIIPDAITSCNLLCGSIAVFLATQGAFIWAFVFILAGAFFDFFDGLSARLLKAPSPIGVQLDSLADDYIRFGPGDDAVLLVEADIGLVGAHCIADGCFLGITFS